MKKRIVIASLLLSTVLLPVDIVAGGATAGSAVTVTAPTPQQGVKKQTIVLPKRTTNWSKIKHLFM